MIGSNEAQAAAVKTMEPYIVWKYKSEDKFRGFLLTVESLAYRDNDRGRRIVSLWNGEYLKVYRGKNANTTFDEEARCTRCPFTNGNSKRGYASFISSEPNLTKEPCRGL